MTNIVHTSDEGFAALGITGKLLASANAAGFTVPTPIQTASIPTHLEGRDILAIAQTGSGKTAAFALPILAKIATLSGRAAPKTARCLILAPTRELAVQIDETIRKLAGRTPVSTVLVLGGASRGGQVKKLRGGVDFVIATPGRLSDLVREREVNLSETRWLVIDEADRMLDMGFVHEVKRLAASTHPRRQTTLYSATMPSEIEQLANGILRNPAQIEVAPRGTTVGKIEQRLIKVPTRAKRGVLAELLANPEMRSVILFSRTKHGADKIARNLAQDGFEAGVIHGNKTQNARQNALNGFKSGRVRILVATDIAARGIDVPGISHVVNFELPDESETYVHRIGRTGRNGADGIAITLCAPEENAKLRSVERLIRSRIEVVADHTGGETAEPAAARPAQAPGPRKQGPRRDKKPGAGKRSSDTPFRAAKPAHGKAREDGAPDRRKRRNRSRPQTMRAA